MTSTHVWIYLSKSPFTQEIEEQLKMEVWAFLHEWNAHGKPLSSSFEILYRHFIIIRVNEEQYAASGCSIDKQLQFIKEVEKKYQVSLLDRLQVAYKKNNTEVAVIHASKIPDLLTQGEINENTIVFNSAVSTEDEFKNGFEIPLCQSWLSRYLTTVK